METTPPDQHSLIETQPENNTSSQTEEKIKLSEELSTPLTKICMV